MKFLTDSQYNKLVNNNNSSEITEVKRLHSIELETHARDRNNEREDYKKVIEILEERQELELEKKTSELNSQIQTLKLEKGNLAKEVEILTKAFENMGFDVKDMKEILNKLVDGIVSKNQIQLVK